MSELTPITRVESYLDAIVNNGIPPTEDITRIETFLQAIYDNQVCALTPVTRIEMFLGKISGQDIELPQPVTRVELYLAAIAGEEVELPENPITRLEMYLAEWADSGDWTTISGAIVEFVTTRAHKLKSCVVSLSPQQDLHGYDSPWPAGGGKNKFDEDTVYSEYKQSDGSFLGRAGYINLISTPIPASCVGQQLTFSAMLKIPSGSIVTNIRVNAKVNGTSISGNAVNSSDYTKSSVTFTPTSASDTVNITFGSESGQNLQFKDIQLEIGSTATSFAPYSNICPISGWTGCEVMRTGKNLIDPAKRYNYQANTHRWYTTDGFVLKANQTYTLSSYPTAAQVYFLAASADATLATGFVKCTYTPAEDTTVCFQLYSSSGASGFELQLELGSTATDYEPYNGDSYSVTFGETVYGGTVDFVSGVLTLDRAYVEYDGSQDETWGEYGQPSDPTYCCVIYPSGKAVGYQKSKCNEFKNENYAFGNPAYGIYSDHPNLINTYFRMPNAEVNSRSAFMTWLANNPIQLVYELATPIEIQLTQQQITALKGYNAMWSDGDSVKVTVRGTPVEMPTQQALNMLLGGAYHNNQTADDVSDDEALEIILGGDNK